MNEVRRKRGTDTWSTWRTLDVDISSSVTVRALSNIAALNPPRTTPSKVSTLNTRRRSFASTRLEAWENCSKADLFLASSADFRAGYEKCSRLLRKLLLVPVFILPILPVYCWRTGQPPSLANRRKRGPSPRLSTSAVTST